jgi:aconitate hydratase
MADRSRDSFQTRSELSVGASKFTYFSLPKFAAKTGKDLSKLPYSLRILLENLLRYEDGIAVEAKDVEALAAWDAKKEPDSEIAFHPARVVLQDFTGVPCVAHSR